MSTTSDKNLELILP